MNYDYYNESAMCAGTYDDDSKRAWEAFWTLQRGEVKCAFDMVAGNEIQQALFAERIWFDGMSKKALDILSKENQKRKSRETLVSMYKYMRQQLNQLRNNSKTLDDNCDFLEALEQADITWRGRKILDTSGEKWEFASRNVAAFVAGELSHCWALIESATGYTNLRNACAKINRCKSPYSEITDIINQCRKERKKQGQRKPQI